jgi:hypothetical protein
MERRKAVIAAATATLTLLAAAVAISINSAIVDASDHGGAGGIDPMATQVTEEEPPADDRNRPAVTIPPDGHDQNEREYEGADDDD